MECDLSERFRQKLYIIILGMYLVTESVSFASFVRNSAKEVYQKRKKEKNLVRKCVSHFDRQCRRFRGILE